MPRWLLGLCFVFFLPSAVYAETVAGLPAPQGYVNDFAGVLSDPVRQQVESLCTAVDRQAHAQVAVVTVKTIDGDQSIEEFATELEEKWKVGAKGTDRGVLMLLVMSPRKGRIEVGYGLEGILNDAKVGDIGRSMVADAQANDYDAAVPLGVRQIATVIATDAGVTLTSGSRASGRQAAQPTSIGIGQILLFVLLGIFVLSVMGRGGRGGRGGGGGLGWFVLGNILGGGLGGGGRGGYGGGFGGGSDNDSGGFGGFDGGSSGGGGASGDF